MKLLNIIKTAAKRLFSHIPSKLPVGITEFNAWADDIISISGKYADEDSMRFAIASILIHADSKFGSLPKSYFVSRLRKSAANQIASQVFQDIKNRQAEAQKAQQAEVTASQESQQNAQENQAKTH